jgi:mannose-6-phosphate isomerase
VEKTELLVAVEPFIVLVGWRPFAATARLLEQVGADESVLAALAAGDPRHAVRLLLTEHQVRADATAWARAVTAAGLDDVAGLAIAAVVARFDGDPGVAVAAMLQSTRLEPSDAVYVPAGVPHAYVCGLGVEIMTSSDNVLRMGLTSKRMSVEHTLAAIIPDRQPTIIRATGSHVYAPAGSPFTAVLARDEEVTAAPGSYRLVLALDDACEVRVDDANYAVAEGSALALPPNAATARVATPGRAVVVSSVEEVA